MYLPIPELLRQAVLTVLYRPKQWLTAFAPLLLVTATVQLMAEQSPLWLGLGILALPLSIAGICAWHRNLITGGSALPRLGKPEWLFFKTSFVIGLICMLPMVPAVVLISYFELQGRLAGLAIIAVGSAAATWMITPTMLSLPVNALGGEPSEDDIKQLLGGNHARLFALIVAIPLAEAALEQILALAGVWTEATALAINLIFWPLGVSVLTLSYIWLRDNRTKRATEE